MTAVQNQKWILPTAILALLSVSSISGCAARRSIPALVYNDSIRIEARVSASKLCIRAWHVDEVVRFDDSPSRSVYMLERLPRDFKIEDANITMASNLGIDRIQISSYQFWYRNCSNRIIALKERDDHRLGWLTIDPSSVELNNSVRGPVGLMPSLDTGNMEMSESTSGTEYEELHATRWLPDGAVEFDMQSGNTWSVILVDVTDMVLLEYEAAFEELGAQHSGYKVYSMVLPP